MAVLKARIGGAWVDVGGGGGSDEVFVGPADPIATAPTTELWYDTDEPAVMTDDMRWNTAWGVVGAGSGAGTVTTSGTTELKLVQAVAFDAVAGRRYKITAEFTVYTTVVGDNFRFVIRRGTTSAGTAVKIGPSFHQSATNAGYHYPITAICQYDTPGATAGLVYHCAVARMTGTGVLVLVDSTTNGINNSIIVEDVGPATGALPAVGGNQYGLEAAKPAAPSTPMQYLATDTKRLWMWDSAGWIVMSEPWQNYTPTSYNISLGGGGSLAGAYRRSDGMCDVITSCFFGTSSAGVITAAGPALSTPFALDSSEESRAATGTCTLNDATGALHWLQPVTYSARIEPRYIAVNAGGGGVSALGQISNTYPITIAVNDYMTIKIRYRLSSRYT